MMRIARKILWVVLLGLFSGAFLAAPAQIPQEQAQPRAKAEQSQQQSMGTGVVPPGVKLVPEMPPGAPPKPFRFPSAESRTLANGLRVFVVADKREPAVTVQLVITSAGTIHDPSKLPGTAEMAANLLTEGTEKRTAQQIAEAIDFVGGSLSASADPDGTSVTATVVKKDFDLAMDLLSDVVLHATFKQEELERRRQQTLSDLSIEYADGSFLASAAFDRVVYGASPYGAPEEGTPASVAQLTRDDLVRFRDATFVPNQSLLVFAGDLDPQSAFAAAEKYFSAWPRKAVPALQIPREKPAEGLHIYLIDKPDAVQTQIRVGRPGIPRDNPDFIPLYVTNRIFGGGYNSRLNTEVRVRKGLTYGARSAFDSHRFAGSFVAATFTRTEKTVEATRLVVDLIGKLATGDITPQELNFARDYLAGVYPIQTETAEQVAGRVLTVAQFGLPADYNDTYQQKIMAVTPDEAKQMAERYFNARDLDLVLVGNASQFRDDLKKAFPAAQWDEIPVAQLDLLSSDLRQPPQAAPPAASSESMDRGHAVLAAAAEAAGGAALSKVENLETKSIGQLFLPQGKLDVEQLTLVSFPDHLHTELKLPSDTLQQTFDGKSGWMASERGSNDLPPELNGELQRRVDLTEGVGIYRQILSGKIQAQYLGQEDVEGKKEDAVQWNAPSGPVKLYFDPVSHLLAAAGYRSMSAGGFIETLQTWDDFRPLAGVKLAYHTLVYHNGVKFSEATFQEVKLNVKIDPGVFTKPK